MVKMTKTATRQSITNSDFSYIINPVYSRSDLTEAIMENDLEEVRAIIESGQVGIDETNPALKTSLMLAAMWGLPAITEYLISQQANVNLRDNNNRTALFHAIYQNGLDDKNFRTKGGQDPHKQKRYADYIKTISLLLEAGAKVNDKGICGDMPLSIASELGAYEVVKMLLEHGANPFPAKDTLASPALDTALKNGYQDVAELIINCPVFQKRLEEKIRTPAKLSLADVMKADGEITLLGKALAATSKNFITFITKAKIPYAAKRKFFFAAREFIKPEDKNKIIGALLRAKTDAKTKDAAPSLFVWQNNNKGKAILSRLSFLTRKSKERD